MDIRNVAIIAHVDHGKTTLVDGLLKQSKTFRDNEAEMSQVLIMDSFDQERERGITILAKNTAINYQGTKINIIDTPGHADFGGEVERTLNMADGALLLIDAQEGPMPQTKFVLKKALELGLKLIVVINKIDKRDARVSKSIEKTHDLFLDLVTNSEQLDFPTYYCIGREGKAWKKRPSDFSGPADLTPIFEAILEHVPAPQAEVDKPLQMQVSNLNHDSFHGQYAIGRIKQGVAKVGSLITVLNESGIKETTKIEKIFTSQGLKKIEITEAVAGDIVSITGLKQAAIGDTICDFGSPIALPSIEIEKPTLKISLSANTSPFAGNEGQFVTSRQILERIKKELQTNVSLKLDEANGEFILFGRGELHLSVFIETMRREGYELQIGKPQIIIKEINGVMCEPIEELTIDVDADKVGSVTAEVGRRRGTLLSQEEITVESTRLVFVISTRGLLGLRNKLLTISKGTAVMNSMFLRYEPLGSLIPKLRNGVLIASKQGKAMTYGLDIAQGRGITFIPLQTEVYAGMIIGLNTREEDIEINVTKEKKQTNVRSSNSDFATILTPPTILSLEQCLDLLENDEFLELTPKNLRLRKKILDPTMRLRAAKV